MIVYIGLLKLGEILCSVDKCVSVCVSEGSIILYSYTYPYQYVFLVSYIQTTNSLYWVFYFVLANVHECQLYFILLHFQNKVLSIENRQP